MKKIEFDKIREAIEADKSNLLARRSGTGLKLLCEIGKYNESPDEIVINFENRWGEDGLEWKARAEYYCPQYSDAPIEVETPWFGDAAGADRETSAICHVLNSILPLRYRLCYAEEMILRGEWFGGRETFFAGGNFPNGVGNQPLPAFVITGGIKGLKRAMRVLGYETSGTIPLVFKKGNKKSKDTMDDL